MEDKKDLTEGQKVAVSTIKTAMSRLNSMNNVTFTTPSFTSSKRVIEGEVTQGVASQHKDIQTKKDIIDQFLKDSSNDHLKLLFLAINMLDKGSMYRNEITALFTDKKCFRSMSKAVDRILANQKIATRR